MARTLVAVGPVVCVENLLFGVLFHLGESYLSTGAFRSVDVLRLEGAVASGNWQHFVHRYYSGFVAINMIGPLIKGLAKTLEQCFRKPITIQYPEQRREVAERFRGHPRLLRDTDGRVKCVACCLCATVCPSRAITIEPGTAGMHEKYPRQFIVDLARCIYCGFCEEACPKGAIQLNRKYELARYERLQLIYDREKLLEDD